ncbi:MAG TPA: energy transducer TonB [Sphingomicrobium sp.]|nr:energy transducer TonB [Sphingomicrobium sp.]
MFWITLAAQLSLPVPLGLPFPDVRSVFSSDDMPAYVQIAGINRFVASRTTVRPDGTVQDCTVERDSGDAKLDAYTCAIIVRRAKFQPAKWIDGSTAYGVIRVPVIWAIGGPPSKREAQEAYPPDMELSVTRLPADADRRTTLALVIGVDENGRVVGCNERPKVSQRDHTKTFPELVPIACQQMMNEFAAIPAKDASGKPMRSVQTASVVFSIGT